MVGYHIFSKRTRPAYSKQTSQFTGPGNHKRNASHQNYSLYPGLTKPLFYSTIVLIHPASGEGIFHLLVTIPNPNYTPPRDYIRNQKSRNQTVQIETKKFFTQKSPRHRLLAAYHACHELVALRMEHRASQLHWQPTPVGRSPLHPHHRRPFMDTQQLCLRAGSRAH